MRISNFILYNAPAIVFIVVPTIALLFMEKLRRRIQREYRESLEDVILGFAFQGNSLTFTATLLSVTSGRLRKFCVNKGLEPRGWMLLGNGFPANAGPSAPRTRRLVLQEMDSDVRARISASMRKRSPKFNFKGRKRTLAGLASESGMNKQTFAERLRRGWSVEKAMETPIINSSELGSIGAAARWGRERGPGNE